MIDKLEERKLERIKSINWSLRTLMGSLTSYVDLLEEITGADGGTVEEPKAEPTPESGKPKLTIEDVRKVCAEKSLEGKSAQVRGLLKKHGADRLSAVNPDEYETLLHEAEVL